MFGIGPEELMLVAVLALLVLGPERLPKVMRDMGRIVGDLRKTSDELRTEFLNADKLLDLSTSGPAAPAVTAPAAETPAASSASDEPAFDREMREARERLRGT
jgi:sec-independent protein translocase protein TatB